MIGIAKLRPGVAVCENFPKRSICHSSAWGTISRTLFQLRPSRPTVISRVCESSAGFGGARSVRARRDAERRPREAIVESAAPAARGACLARAPGAWRARVCIAFSIMVVSCAVLVVL